MRHAQRSLHAHTRRRRRRCGDSLFGPNSDWDVFALLDSGAVWVPAAGDSTTICTFAGCVPGSSGSVPGYWDWGGVELAESYSAMPGAPVGPSWGPSLWTSVKSFFGYDPSDPRPSCFGDVFAKTVGNDLNPFAPNAFDIGKGILEVGSAAAFNRALDYAGSRGLISPFRSSTFRLFIGRSTWLAEAAEYAPAVGILAALTHGLVREISVYRKGACQ